MYQNLVYQSQNWPSFCIWRDLYLCKLSKVIKSLWLNVHPDKLIYLLVLNLKMPITKVNGVSFGIPKDCMLQNLTMMPLSMISSKP